MGRTARAESSCDRQVQQRINQCDRSLSDPNSCFENRQRVGVDPTAGRLRNILESAVWTNLLRFGLSLLAFGRPRANVDNMLYIAHYVVPHTPSVLFGCATASSGASTLAVVTRIVREGSVARSWRDIHLLHDTVDLVPVPVISRHHEGRALRNEHLDPIILGE